MRPAPNCASAIIFCVFPVAAAPSIVGADHHLVVVDHRAGHASRRRPVQKEGLLGSVGRLDEAAEGLLPLGPPAPFCRLALSPLPPVLFRLLFPSVFFLSSSLLFFYFFF